TAPSSGVVCVWTAGWTRPCPICAPSMRGCGASVSAIEPRARTPTPSAVRWRDWRIGWPPVSWNWGQTGKKGRSTARGRWRWRATRATTSGAFAEPDCPLFPCGAPHSARGGGPFRPPWWTGSVPPPLRPHPFLLAQMRVLRLQCLRRHGSLDARLPAWGRAGAGAGRGEAAFRIPAHRLLRRRYAEPAAGEPHGAHACAHPWHVRDRG